MYKLRKTKKDKKKDTFHKFGKYTSKASRIKDKNLEKLKEKQLTYQKNQQKINKN